MANKQLNICGPAVYQALDAVEVGGGIGRDNLADLVARLIASGASSVGLAVDAQAWAGSTGGLLMTAQILASMYTPQAITPSGGNAAIDGTLFEFATLSITGDITFTSITGLLARPKFVLVTTDSSWRKAIGNNFDYRLNMGGKAGIMLPPSSKSLFLMFAIAGDDYLLYLGTQGDPEAAVVLTPGAGSPNTIAIDGNNIPTTWSAVITAATEISVPSNLSGKTLRGFVTASGANRVLSVASGWDIKIGWTGTVTIPSGKTAVVLIERQTINGSGANIVEYAAVQD